VLHVLDHSIPVLDGYSHRSRSLISAQKSFGWEPSVLTGPLHNLDDPTAAEIDVDGVHYFRTPNENNFFWRAIRRRRPFLREWAVVRLLTYRISALLQNHEFDVVHAHSPALCGLAAARASRAASLPFVYEIRSFWEDGVDQSTASLRYRLARGLETNVVKRSDAVVGIAKPILQDIAARGVPQARLFHVPNGVDAARFTPRARDIELAATLGVSNTPTLGFIGTFFPWEGVAWLVRAARALHDSGVPFKLLVVGDGAEAGAVRAAIRECGAENYVSYLGRVPHHDVERYYSVMDVVVYPRHRLRITEAVTPLKPLEAMALGKAILGSGVGGIRELVDPGKTAILFEPDNIQDFCKEAADLLKNPSLREELGIRARKKACEEKDWKTVARLYEPAYATAIENASHR
jgi:PEP-CTERM/exosortase A-associated glycosyltransferase